MRNILRTPQRVLDDCPNHPRLASAFYRLFLTLVPLVIAAYILILTDKASSLTYAAIVGVVTIGFCILIVGISAHKDNR
jgi:hypothetical protein